MGNATLEYFRETLAAADYKALLAQPMPAGVLAPFLAAQGRPVVAFFLRMADAPGAGAMIHHVRGDLLPTGAVVRWRMIGERGPRIELFFNLADAETVRRLRLLLALGATVIFTADAELRYTGGTNLKIEDRFHKELRIAIDDGLRYLLDFPADLLDFPAAVAEFQERDRRHDAEVLAAMTRGTR